MWTNSTSGGSIQSVTISSNGTYIAVAQGPNDFALYISAIENWKENIDYYSRALEKAPSPDENNLITLRENISNLYIKFLSIDCTLTKGFSVIFKDKKIITKPVLGLNIFLKAWLERSGNDEI